MSMASMVYPMVCIWDEFRIPLWDSAHSLMHGSSWFCWLWLPILYVIFLARRFLSSLRRMFIQFTLASTFASSFAYGGTRSTIRLTRRGFHLLLSTDQPPLVLKGGPSDNLSLYLKTSIPHQLWSFVRGGGKPICAMEPPLMLNSAPTLLSSTV